MSEFELVGEDDFCILSDVKRPSKAAERKGWRRQAQEELEELKDLYPDLAEVLNEVRF